IEIAVYCAIRPSAKSLQVSNGRGLGQADAKVSALMEAIELHHFENPPSNLRRGSLRSLQREGHHVIEPDTLPCYRSDVFFSADRVIDWVSADELLSAKEVWLPASAAFMCPPLLYDSTSNGVASGNHLIEATLHGLYEVIERDAVARLSVNGRLNFSRRRSRFYDLKTLTDPAVSQLHAMLVAAGV